MTLEQAASTWIPLLSLAAALWGLYQNYSYLGNRNSKSQVIGLVFRNVFFSFCSENKVNLLDVRMLAA